MSNNIRDTIHDVCTVTNATVFMLTVFLVLFSFSAVATPSDRTMIRARITDDLSHNSGRLGAYKALIIGIDDYEDPKITDLKTAVNDANSMTKILRDKYNFKVETLLNREATRKAIITALRNLAGSATENDSVLLYYGGHGDLDKLYDDGWWIPADAKAGDSSTYLDNTKVQKAMKGMRARHALLISDSCYSGTLFGSRAMPAVIDDKFYLNMYNEKSRWGLTSGSKEPVADIGLNGHSVFAYQLLKELNRNRQPYLAIQELYTKIAPIIGNNSSQTPICQPIRDTGDQGGQFILVANRSSNIVKQRAPESQTVVLPPTTTGLNSLDSVIQARRDARSKWSAWQLKMDADFKKAENYDSDTVLTSTEKIGVWSDFLSSYEIDNPHSNNDETWRDKAIVRKNYWMNQKGAFDSSKPAKTANKPGSTNTTYTDPVTGMEFVKVPGGCYDMGDTFDEGGDDEKPVHEVCVTDFWLGKYEVTQREWQKIMDDNPSHFKKGDRYPVEKVSWDDASSYIKKINLESGKGFRLPTEAEWEYAAREKGKKVRFGTGKNSIGADEANFDASKEYKKSYSRIGQYRNSTVAVGSFAPNKLGLYDMSGNVWEWSSDWYQKDYYSASTRVNPQGPSSGSSRVIRGGSWLNGPRYVRSANRNGGRSGKRNDYLGLRLAFSEGKR